MEAMGFRVLEGRKVERGGVCVGEVDLVAEREGKLYAVEVKAGRVSVHDVRQAYVNAQLLGASPLAVGRGFANEEAEELARVLGVEVVSVPDYLVVAEPEELLRAVEWALADLLARALQPLLNPLSEEELKLLEVVARSGSLAEAAQRAGVDARQLREAVAKLSERGFANVKAYPLLRLQAVLSLLRSTLLEQVLQPHPLNSL